MDRTCKLPELGKVDREAGEFWVENPFLIPLSGKNLSAYERNCVFLNAEGRGFVDASFASAADLDADSRSVVAGDFTGDGAPDLLVGSVGGGPLRLLANALPQGNRARIVLVGTTSNRSGIGCRATAQCGAASIVRDVFPANGFMGQGPGELLLGVGAAKQIDALTIRWPDGKTQKFETLPVGATIVITEGEQQPATTRWKTP